MGWRPSPRRIDRGVRARRRWRAALAALLVAAGVARAQDSGPVPLERLYTSDVGVLFTVAVEIGGERGRWLVDTGASRHLVTPAFARRLGLRELGRSGADTAFGTLHGPEVALPSLRLGQRRLDGQRALVVDVPALAGPATAGIDGVLGAPALLDGALDLDLAASVLRTRADAPAGCDAPRAALPLELRRGLPVVALRVEGRIAFALIDTGYAGALAQIDGERPAARASDVALGPLVRRQVPVMALRAPALRVALAGDARQDDVTALAGAALLDGAALRLSPRDGVLCVAPDERTLSGSFGFGLGADANGLFVDAVSDGSPAALAGLREGDRVRQWNGAAPTTVADAWAAVHGLDMMTLVVERHGVAIARVLRRAHPAPPP